MHTKDINDEESCIMICVISTNCIDKIYFCLEMNLIYIRSFLCVCNIWKHWNYIGFNPCFRRQALISICADDSKTWGVEHDDLVSELISSRWSQREKEKEREKERGRDDSVSKIILTVRYRIVSHRIFTFY